MPRRSAVVAAVLPFASGPSRFETRVRGRPPVRSPRRQPPCRRWRSSSWRPTCPSVPAVPIISSSQAHLTHVGTLSGPGTRPDIRPVGSGSPAEEPAHRPGFPVAFRPTGVRFLGHPVPPGSYAFLTVGRPDTCRYPDPDGVSTFHVHETRPGGVPSRPRDGGALPTDAESSVGTRRYQRRTSRQGRALSTGPGLRSRHQHRSALLPASPLIARHRTRPRVARR